MSLDGLVVFTPSISNIASCPLVYFAFWLLSVTSMPVISCRNFLVFSSFISIVPLAPLSLDFKVNLLVTSLNSKFTLPPLSLTLLIKVWIVSFLLIVTSLPPKFNLNSSVVSVPFLKKLLNLSPKTSVNLEFNFTTVVGFSKPNILKSLVGFKVTLVSVPPLVVPPLVFTVISNFSFLDELTIFKSSFKSPKETSFLKSLFSPLTFFCFF